MLVLFQDMLDAFPNQDRVNSGNMRQFAAAVAGLLHISDFQRRRITHMMRHYRDMRRRSPPLPSLAVAPASFSLYMHSLTCPCFEACTSIDIEPLVMLTFVIVAAQCCLKRHWLVYSNPHTLQQVCRVAANLLPDAHLLQLATTSNSF